MTAPHLCRLKRVAHSFPSFTNGFSLTMHVSEFSDLKGFIGLEVATGTQ